MGWEDRPYYRDRRGYSNPILAALTGSVPLFTAFGVRVRAHVFLLIFIALELLLGPEPLESRVVSLAMLAMVLILHEYGHCFAARRLGGTASEVILWPLGGLRFPEPPRNPRAHFITAVGGPLTNVAVC